MSKRFSLGALREVLAISGVAAGLVTVDAQARWMG